MAKVLIDKSLFQSLTAKSLPPLDRHFEVIIPPILIKEILGDLSTNRKIKDREVDVKSFVAKMADRFGVNSIVCHDYFFLLYNSLLGYETPMDGRIVAAGLTPVATDDGKSGYKVLPTYEDKTLMRWQQHEFSVEEAFWAYRWQRIRKFISTRLYLNKLIEMGIIITSPKSLEELNETVENILSNPKIQGRLLGLINREFRVPFDIQRQVVLRWFQLKCPFLKGFAPYAAYCLKANLLLAIGNINEQVFGRQHEHDLRDLEYCYYLPFCEVFASDDKIHRKLIGLLMRPDQKFVGLELRNDLKRLGEEWFSFSQEEKIEHRRKFGFKPAFNDNSVVWQLWEEFRPDYDSSNVILPKHNGELHQSIKGLFDKLDKAKQTANIKKEGSFLIHSRSISKKKLRELYPDVDFDLM